MAVAVPNVVADARVLHARMKPGPRIEAAVVAFTREYGIGGVLLWQAKRLDGLNRVRVEMDGPSRSVLRLREFDCPAIQVNLRPSAGVLLTEAHSSVHAHHKFGQMLGKTL